MAELNDEDLRMIRETFGLTQRLDQSMSDHLKWSEKMSEVRNKEIKDIQDRLKPVEEFHSDIKRGFKMSAVVGLPVIATLSAAFWEAMKAAAKKWLGVTP